MANSHASRDPATHEGNALLQGLLPPPSSSNRLGIPAPAPASQIPDGPKPPRPSAFEKVGDPILEPEFNYVVSKAMEARKAGFQDDLNDFEPDEERPMEIHAAWIKFGCPTSFRAFQTMRKGKGHAVDTVQAYSEPNKPSTSEPSTSADQPDPLTGALSEKFGLPEPMLKALSSKAVAKAQRLSHLPKDTPAAPKYKPLKGTAKEEASALIDQTLTTLLRLSQKHGTDPTAATKLFQKKLDYFSSSLWDMWEMHHAVKRATKHTEGKEDRDSKEDEEEEACESRGGDEVSGSDGEDASQRTSITQITAIPHNLP